MPFKMTTRPSAQPTLHPVAGPLQSRAPYPQPTVAPSKASQTCLDAEPDMCLRMIIFNPAVDNNGKNIACEKYFCKTCGHKHTCDFTWYVVPK